MLVGALGNNKLFIDLIIPSSLAAFCDCGLHTFNAAIILTVSPHPHLTRFMYPRCDKNVFRHANCVGVHICPIAERRPVKWGEASKTDFSQRSAGRRIYM